MTKSKPNDPVVPAIAPVLLLVAALAESLLSLYQWMELVLVRSGGKAICALNDTVNCTTVWNSSFASRIHGLLGVPIAALGLVWGLTAFGLALALSHRLAVGKSPGALIAALKVTAAAGALSCVSFAVGSYNAGALCLTCLTTFALVFTFAGLTFKLLPGAFPPPAAELKPALTWCVALGAACFVALLYPGLQTPSARREPLAVKPVTNSGGGAAATPSETLRTAAEYLAKLTPPEQQAVADTLAAYKRSPARDVSSFLPRHRYGPDGAPMKLVEFTDVRCGHCRALVETLKQIEEAVPPGSLSVEARHFPLDGECNKVIGRTDGTGLSCLGAKVQICLEGAPDFWTLREKLFAAQDALTKERIMEIASSGSVKREALTACVTSPETQGKLDQDIAFAMLYNPDGTPLVLVNGRVGESNPSWLYAMVLAGADPESAVFQALPPPGPESSHQHRH